MNCGGGDDFGSLSVIYDVLDHIGVTESFSYFCGGKVVRLCYNPRTGINALTFSCTCALMD